MNVSLMSVFRVIFNSKLDYFSTYTYLKLNNPNGVKLI